MKDFKGTIEASDEARAPATLSISDTHMAIHLGGERLGMWPFDQVEVMRTASDRFALDLEDERVIFIAANPIDFAYTVPGWVESHKSKKRRGIQKRLEVRKESLVRRIEQSGGRRRTRKLAKSAEHTHSWREQTLPGGLVRRICADCGHVSIDLRDADLPEEIIPEPETPSATA